MFNDWILFSGMKSFLTMIVLISKNINFLFYMMDKNIDFFLILIKGDYY